METSLSLLKRLQLGEDGQDWVAFCELYHPLLMNWCKRQVGNIEDTEDVVQNVFMDIFRNIKYFKHEGKPGTLRAYLKRILRSKVSNLYRERVPELVDFDELDELILLSHSNNTAEACEKLFRQACEIVKCEFEETTWLAFIRTHMGHEKAESVGVDMGLSRNSVYVSRCRIIIRIKECLADLII